MNAKLHVCAIAIAATLLALLPGNATARQEGQDAVRLRGAEVLLDLVATDKKGRPVVDLAPGEIEVFENGVRQSVTSFGLVRVGGDPRGAASTAAAPPSALAYSPLKDVNLILLVVDRGSVQTENLVQIRRAAERFVEERLATNDLVGVFVTTNQLVMVQNFTSNKTRLLRAIETATQGTSVALQESLDADARARLVEAQNAAGAPPSNDPEQRDAELNRLLADAAAGIDTAFANIRDQVQALSVVNGLLALTKLYSAIPGRKSIVLYSEGFVVADETKGAFDAMIAAANRGNFTIYPVSAGGLSATVRTGAVMPRRGRPIEETDERMTVQGGESGLDRMVKPLRTDNDQALGQIAAETGGVLVRNTNDLGRGFDAIENDLRSYYAISYAPTNAELDGTFREIAVKVGRKDVEIRTRKGYYAVPGGTSSILLPFEQPLLAMLAAKTGERPSALKVSLRTERFPASGGWRVPVLLGVDATQLEATKLKNRPDAVDFAVDAVVLVRDEAGTVVAKLSRPTLFRMFETDVAAFRERTVTIPPFEEPLVLAPGRYTLQVGVFDPHGRRGTTLERNITIPPAPGREEIALGSLVLATTVETVPASMRERASEDPFVVGGAVRVLPSPTANFSKSRTGRLVAFFTLRGAPSASYRMQLQFFRGGEPVVNTPVEAIPATDANGFASAAPIVPLDTFTPGTYRAILLVLGPDSTKPLATAVTSFQLEE